MRKYFLLLIPLLIGGCEKDFDTVIDVSSDNYQVTTVIVSTPTGIKDTIDLKEPSDSLLTLRIIFSPESQVNRVYFDVHASDNTILNSSPVFMNRVSATNTFENQFILKSNNPIGNYKIIFTVTGNSGANKQAAVSNFYFNNGQDNLPPVISNVVIPDTIARDVFFNFSVTVSDPNGLNDINKDDGVFFILYRPDSTVVEQSPFYMRDNGDPGFGDEVADDGIFSFRNSFSVTAQTGNWRFVFQARDRSGLLSNIIEHLLYVQ